MLYDLFICAQAVGPLISTASKADRQSRWRRSADGQRSRWPTTENRRL